MNLSESCRAYQIFLLISSKIFEGQIDIESNNCSKLLFAVEHQSVIRLLWASVVAAIRPTVRLLYSSVQHFGQTSLRRNNWATQLDDSLTTSATLSLCYWEILPPRAIAEKTKVLIRSGLKKMYLHLCPIITFTVHSHNSGSNTLSFWRVMFCLFLFVRLWPGSTAGQSTLSIFLGFVFATRYIHFIHSLAYW